MSPGVRVRCPGRLWLTVGSRGILREFIKCPEHERMLSFQGPYFFSPCNSPSWFEPCPSLLCYCNDLLLVTVCPLLPPRPLQSVCTRSQGKQRLTLLYKILQGSVPFLTTHTSIPSLANASQPGSVLTLTGADMLEL